MSKLQKLIDKILDGKNVTYEDALREVLKEHGY